MKAKCKGATIEILVDDCDGGLVIDADGANPNDYLGHRFELTPKQADQVAKLIERGKKFRSKQ